VSGEPYVHAVFTGPLLPDYDINAAGGCHDSFFSKVVGVNASVANITGEGRHCDNVHTFNESYPDVGGSARYGLETVNEDFVGFPPRVALQYSVGHGSVHHARTRGLQCFVSIFRRFVRKTFHTRLEDAESGALVSRDRLGMVVGIGVQPDAACAAGPDLPKRMIEKKRSEPNSLRRRNEAEICEFDFRFTHMLEFA
jgi:hypothetical protein